MEDILDLGVREGRIYKHGSGSGVNYSSLRSSHEDLSTTGTASGPVPFIDKDDRNAGAIKSGGTTRRAAKMVILNADHGDIIEFVCSKQIAERAAKVLVAAGFDKDFRARLGAYGLLPFQNGNHSVRVTEEFMQAVAADGPWNLLARDGKVLQTIRARVLWDLICIAAYECGCPGLQFDSVINGWHTCPNTARINASNPCSEYMFLDDSACNLASLNLRRFQREDGTFDIEAYEAAVDVTILAQEVIVDGSSYPTERIARNSHLFRPLGLGFANLGSALMCAGLAYDSPRGRDLAAGLTALMGGRAYQMSARIARRVGPFEGWRENREPCKTLG
jgi:ribonucleoside-diphosphate reductase alpha chain